MPTDLTPEELDALEKLWSTNVCCSEDNRKDVLRLIAQARKVAALEIVPAEWPPAQQLNP